MAQSIICSNATQWKSMRSQITSVFIGSECIGIGMEQENEPVLKLWEKKAFSTVHGLLNTPENAVLFGHEKEIVACRAYSPNGKHDTKICTVSYDKMFVWAIKDNFQIQKHLILDEINKDTTDIAFDKTGTMVALAQNKEIIVVLLASGSVYVRLEGHLAQVTGCQFHPVKTNLLITVSQDRTFKVWDVQHKFVLYQSAVLSAYPILSMNINQYDGKISLGFADGILRVFEPQDDSYYREALLVDFKKSLLKINIATNNTGNLNQDESKPVVVSTLPSWSKFSSDSKVENEDCNTEVACPILQIAYLEGDEHDEELKGTNATGFQRPEDSDVFKSFEWMVVGTTNHIFLINAITCEISILQNFQDPIYGHEVLASDFLPQNVVGPSVKLAKGMVFTNFDHYRQISCGILSAFEACFTTFTLFVQDGDAPKGILDSSIAISVFPKTAPSCTSPLTSTYVYEQEKGKRDKNDKPVTFHSSIRSSGYGSALPPIPLGGRTKKPTSKMVKKKRQSMSTCQEYPMQCSILSEYQPNNQLPRDALHVGPIYAIKYSPNGKLLSIGANDKGAYSLNLPFSKYMGDGKAFQGHESAVQTTGFSHRHDLLVTSAKDNSVRVWHPSSDDPLLIFEQQPKLPKSTAQTPRTRRRSSISKTTMPSTIATGHTSDASFYYLDKFVVSSYSNRLTLYHYQVDLKQKQKKKSVVTIRELQSQHLARQKFKIAASFEVPDLKQINSLTCNNSFLTHLIICAGSNKNIYVYDASTNKIVCTFKDAHDRAPHTVRLPSTSDHVSHPPNCYDVLLSAASDSTVHLWDIRMRKLGMRFGTHTNRVHKVGVGFSPCMRFVAVGSEDKNCYIYDVRKGTCMEKLQGHQDVVSSIDYHPIYPQLATASYDGTIRFYTEPNY